MNHITTGKQGENHAAAYLKGAGYSIVTRNWRCKYGEIDIVAQRDDTLVFVEVRTRHARTTESAFVSITASKQQRMVKSAQLYLSENDIQLPWRIDAIAIALPRSGPPVIEHVEDALGW